MRGLPRGSEASSSASRPGMGREPRTRAQDDASAQVSSEAGRGTGHRWRMLPMAHQASGGAGCSVPGAHLDACSKPVLQKEEGTQREGLLSKYVCWYGQRGRWVRTLKVPVLYSAHSQSMCSKVDYTEIQASVFTLMATSHLNRVFPKPYFPYSDGKGDRDGSCQD